VPKYDGPAADGAAGEADDRVFADKARPDITSKTPKLRPYQLDVIDRIETEVANGHRRICLVAPTGSGKTVVAAALVAEGRLGCRVLIVVHRRELTDQTSQKLHAVGVDHGIIQARFPTRPGEPVQIASIQTLHARRVRTSTIEMPPADLVIIDEAHHARARTYERLIKAYPSAVILGMTATPCRSDGRGLGNIFGRLVECPSTAELTRDGYLVPVKIFAPSLPDLTGLRVERGDYVESQLAERVNTTKLVGDIVEHWHRFGEGRRTVVFTVNVPHSVHIRDEFRRSGALAEHIDGATPLGERKKILVGFAAGRVDVVCNCAVLTEGWDPPEASCLILARPTKSLGLFRQMSGRILRPAPGKIDAIILDHAGSVFAHGFPDDEIIWTLHEDRRAENIAHAARGQLHAQTLTTCPECCAVRLEGQPCPACGWHHVRTPRLVEVSAGELGQVSPDRSVQPIPQDQQSFHQQLAWIAKQRGYKPGWVAHKYKQRFGAWPPQRLVEPRHPHPATLAWVRAGARAYARAMASS
jgi:superfamily II DNA or RNA helicase